MEIERQRQGRSCVVCVSCILEPLTINMAEVKRVNHWPAIKLIKLVEGIRERVGTKRVEASKCVYVCVCVSSIRIRHWMILMMMIK